MRTGLKSPGMLCDLILFLALYYRHLEPDTEYHFCEEQVENVGCASFRE